MDIQGHIEELLAHAKLADGYAMGISDSQMKASWLRIADVYRDLAKLYQNLNAADASRTPK